MFAVKGRGHKYQPSHNLISVEITGCGKCWKRFEDESEPENINKLAFANLSSLLLFLNALADQSD